MHRRTAIDGPRPTHAPCARPSSAARIAAAAAFALAAGLASADEWSRPAAESLLRRWSDAVLRHQVGGTGDAFVDGGVICPACCFEHGRIADFVYPLVYLWKRTGERRYLEAAERMFDWTEANMVAADGANINDVKHYWKGITVFSQISLGKTLMLFGADLPADVRAKWTARFRVQTEFVERFFSDGLGTANINYPVAFCEAMAVASRVLGEVRFLEKAVSMYELLRPLFLADGLLAGEGHPSDGVSPRGCRPVDIGYNMEESLPALYGYAELAGREDVAKDADRMVAAHLEFMLPDGGLDNSMGSRSCKWTYWGSRTSDGMLPALAHYAKRGGKGGVRAIGRHLRLLERCTSADGLLYGGLHYREAGEPPCIHHAFAHAKALVELLLAAPPEKSADEPLPREAEYGHRRFRSTDTDLAAIGKWRASFSANDFYSNRGGVDVGGGSLTLLWHEDLGITAAATMSDFRYVEYCNFQDQRRYAGVLTTTPRIESGAFSSVRDRSAKVEGESVDGAFVYRAEGRLVDGDMRASVPFSLEYRLSQGGLAVTAKASGPFRYVFPVVTTRDAVEVKGRIATVRTERGVVRLESSREVRLLETPRGRLSFTPIAGLMTANLYVESDGAPVNLRISAQSAD